jgi:hypothetical protein
MIKLILIISFLLISVDGFAQLNQNNRVISSPAEIELSPNTKTISKKDINIESNYVLKLEDAAGGQYVGIKSPATVSPSWTLTLPGDDGTAGYLLSTDGAGVTSWIAAPVSFTNTALNGEVMISQGAGSGSGEAAFAYDFGTNVLSLDGQLNIKSQNELRLQDTTGGQYIGLKANGTTTSYTLTFPAAQGSSGQVLQNNGSGVLSWVANNGLTIETQMYTIRQAQNAMSDLSGELEFNLGTATIENEGTALITVADDAANTRTEFTSNYADVDVTFSCSSSSMVAAGNQRLEIVLDASTEIAHGSTAAAGTQSATVTVSRRLASGEYLTIQADSSITSSGTQFAQCTLKAMRVY